jgi:type II secretory pathway component PulM
VTKPGQEPPFDAFSAPAEVSPGYGQTPIEHTPRPKPEPVEPRESRKKPALVVPLAAAAVLFLVLAVVFGALYAGAKSDTDKATAQAADKERQVSDLNKQLQEATESLATAKEGKTAAENKNNGLAKCGDAAKILAAALRSTEDNEAQVQDLSTALVILCN